MSLPTFPNLTSPKFMRNLALATLLPAGAAYAFARYVQGKMTEQEATEFEKQIDEYTKAENPVISLDPNVNDAKEEKKLEELGLHQGSAVEHTAAGLGSAKALGAKLWSAMNAHPNITAGAVATPFVGAYGYNKLKPTKSFFTGEMEPGLLLAAAYIAGLVGMAAGRKGVADDTSKKMDKQLAQSQNQLEASEYDRLHQISDPESYAQSQAEKKKQAEKEAKRKAEETVPKVSYTEADMINSMVLIQKKAAGGSLAALAAGFKQWKALPGWAPKQAVVGTWNRSPTWLKVGGGVGAGMIGAPIVKGGANLVGLGASATGTAVEAFKKTYPLAFAILLLGGLAAGKHFSDQGDPARIRKKALKKFLTEEMLTNQSPTILEVGDTLPWEKAQAGGAEAAQSDEALSEEAQEKETKSRKEIRI